MPLLQRWQAVATFGCDTSANQPSNQQIAQKNVPAALPEVASSNRWLSFLYTSGGAGEGMVGDYVTLLNLTWICLELDLDLNWTWLGFDWDFESQACRHLRGVFETEKKMRRVIFERSRMQTCTTPCGMCCSLQREYDGVYVIGRTRGAGGRGAETQKKTSFIFVWAAWGGEGSGEIVEGKVYRNPW